MKAWTLGARVTALSVATAIVLGIIAAAAAGVALGNRGEVDRLLNRDTPLALNAQGLLTALVNQETGIRGYALTGRSDDLQPYDQGVRGEATSEANLLRLLGDRPDLAGQVRQIQGEAAQWRAAIAMPVIEAVRAGDRTSAQAQVEVAARNQFDIVRADVGRLQDAIADLREQTVASVKDSSRQLVELLVAAGLVILLAAVLLIVLLRYLVARPVAHLAAEVRTVAGGDYEHIVVIDGPPEVTRLAGDVESMRRRIVKDLREVARARQGIEAANRQLEQQTDELTRSNRDLEQFAYVASHGANSPLPSSTSRQSRFWRRGVSRPSGSRISEIAACTGSFSSRVFQISARPPPGRSTR